MRLFVAVFPPDEVSWHLRRSLIAAGRPEVRLTPIESPGDAAIEAAASPPEGDWIYYVTVNLDTGETKFTEDYDEFLRWKNVELAEYCEGSDRC